VVPPKCIQTNQKLFTLGKKRRKRCSYTFNKRDKYLEYETFYKYLELYLMKRSNLKEMQKILQNPEGEHLDA
jgi:hypothetical protein